MIELLNISTTVSIGLLAGALLTEACILLPYWRKMNPDDFFRLHSSIGLNLFRFFAPLTTIAVVLATLSGAIGISGKNASLMPLAACGLCLMALAVFFIYFKKANQKFANHSIQSEELGAELARWTAWHWFRTGLIIVAFGCSATALTY